MSEEKNKPKHRTYLLKIKKLSQNNRKNMTVAETKLWYQLKSSSKGFKFRRQFSVDNKYIVDFICLEKRLIIEVDGGQHNENIADKERTKYLEQADFKVIRFWNNDILTNMQGCLDSIYNELNG